MRSRRTIETGTVQYGLKLISMILLWMSGDGRSGLPTTGGVPRDHGIALHRLDLSGRDVAHDETTRGAAEGAQPRQIGLELIEPHRRGNVERTQGLLAHDAVDRKPVARLEAPHRRLDIGIIDVADAAAARFEIADRGEALAQRRDRGMAHAEPHPIRRRHLWPTSA